MNYDIVVWLNDNQDFLIETIKPFIHEKKEWINNSDPVFHDEINNQYQDVCLSIIGIKVCKDLGCSVEEYYETVEDENVFKYLITTILEGEQDD